jgi:tetratricopeptide (TPR) repeat protein
LLLEYIMQAEQRGAGDALKAYTIGIDVLNRPTDFDPAIDSSVRVEMGRLRTALAIFEGSDDPKSDIVVEIPVGSYRPIITVRAETNAPTPSPQGRMPANRAKALGIFAAVILLALALFASFANDESSAPPDYAVSVVLAPFLGDPLVASQVELSLRRSLLPNRAIAIASSVDGNMQDVDFSLHGLVSPIDASRTRVDVELTRIATNRVVWGTSIVVEDGDDIEERIVTEIGSELRVRLLGASKELLAEREPSQLNDDQLFVVATWVPGHTTQNALEWEQERIALMNWALSREPDLGTTHSVMADKLSQLANFYPAANTRALNEKALRHANLAMALAPFNPDVVFNVAQSHWHAGRIAESHAAMRRVLDLDPGHNLARFLSLVVPYTCTAPPAEVTQQAIAFDRSLSPDNPIRWITLSWIAALHFNSGDYDRALEEDQRAALIFEGPYTFMRRAMVLNKLGRPNEAAAVILRQRENWPDISPGHFARVTMPRLCGDAPLGQIYIENARDFAVAMDGLL